MSGVYEPKEAVLILLKGTQLTIRTDEATGVMLVVPPTAPKASSSVSEEPAPASPPNTARESSVPEILVQGARTLNMDLRRSEDDIQPYRILNRQEIERSGATSLEQFLKMRLTMNGSATSTSQASQTGTSASSINLRGLGANQTLILIDGHRTAAYSLADGNLQQPDINGIPLSAIERIEVLPTTASGIYGGSATGGVINIILRRDYSGIETKLAYGGTFSGGGENGRVDLSGGFNLEGGRTNIVFAASYSDARPLFTSERDLTERGRQRILDRNPSALLNASVPPLGASTNICALASATASTCSPTANLVLDDGRSLNASRTYVPAGFNVDRVQAPMLFMFHGRGVAQVTLEISSAFKRNRRASEIVFFPQGSHQLQMPREREASLSLTVDWMRYWLQGVESGDKDTAARVRRWRKLKELVRPEATSDPAHAQTRSIDLLVPVRSQARADRQRVHFSYRWAGDHALVVLVVDLHEDRHWLR